MNLYRKNVLVLGLGISGVSIVKSLDKLGANIIISDSKSESSLRDSLNELKDIGKKLYLGGEAFDLKSVDLLVKSPGIPLDNPIVLEALNKNIEVLTDLELAYRINKGNTFIAITGTNGKTTTTSLVGEIFKESGRPTHIVGNIGIGLLWEVVNSKDKDDLFIIEASSFQLDTTVDFAPNISCILNISPDHLDWHGTMDKYIGAKEKILNKQKNEDISILNYDDEILRKLGQSINSKLMFFSRREILNKGVYIEDGYVTVKDGNHKKQVIHIDEIKILGQHNLENALAATAIAYSGGVDFTTIKKVLKKFPGVAHRVEYVETINNISFYNDSKGTNTFATIKAIEALENSIVLIAGGRGKGTGFDDLIENFKGRVKALVLLGEAKEEIRDASLKHGFTHIHLVDKMDEAVKKAFEIGEEGDNILLSPACSSWDMYPNFEVRGDDFKKSVYSLKGD